MPHIIHSYVTNPEGKEVAGGPIMFNNGRSAFVHIFKLVIDAITRGSEIRFTDLDPDSITHNCTVGLQYKEEE